MARRRINELDFMHYGVPFLRIFYPVQNYHGGRWRSLARAWRLVSWATYRRKRDGHKNEDYRAE